MRSMTADRFFSFCLRLIHYQGALRATFEEQQAQEQQARLPASERPSGQVRHYRDIHHNPELAQYFG